MDETLARYRELLRLLEQEYEAVGTALGHELLQKYQRILKEEMEMVQKQMQLFYILIN